MRGNLIIGAIGGDILGSRFEHEPVKSKRVELLHDECTFTDDTVMMVAVMKWLLEDDGRTTEGLVKTMKELGARYPDAGYGATFWRWLKKEDPQPYGSWGNGSAMRVSPVAYAASSLDEALELAIITASVSHDHVEGIKGAKAVAAAMFMALLGMRKYKMVAKLKELFPSYDLSRELDTIRPDYKFDVSCQGSVPESLIAFLEGGNYEDTVLNAISLGGDADTMAAIAGGISEAYSKEDMYETTRKFIISKIPQDLLEIVTAFSEKYNGYIPQKP